MRMVAGIGIMCAGTAVALLCAMVTLFQAPGLTRAIAAHTSRLVLRVYGVTVRVDERWAIPSGQVVFISNHTSTLDLFVLTALNLRRTRFFLSRFLRWYGPLGIMAMLMGTFFTVPQRFHAERSRMFAAAAAVLRRTGDSTYLSPEGGRITTGQIGHFNKGAFHLAASLGAPIVPLYIAIPPSADPGMGVNARSGRVVVHILPAIPTQQWRVEDAAAHAEDVRAMYVTWHAHFKKEIADAATGTAVAAIV